MKSKFNSLRLGLILGLILPVISILVFYLFNCKNYTLPDFIKQLISRNVYTQLISLCVVPNLLLFFLFIWRNFFLSARGVLFATFIYAFLVVVIKFLT